MATDEWTFGEVDDPEELMQDEGAEPIEFTLIGYDRKTLAKKEFVFLAKGEVTFGDTFDVFRGLTSQGMMPLSVSTKLISNCLLDDEQLEKWEQVTHDDTLRFDSRAVGQMAVKFLSFYQQNLTGRRPTQPRAVRRAGQRQTGKTSTAGRSARASASQGSGSRTP